MLHFFPPHVARSVAALDTNLSAGVSVLELPDLVNRTVGNGGKRLRPALLFLLADLFDVPAATAAPYARAAELLHSATLVHDDVVDEAPVRRGQPTINAALSNARAVLAGDLLLSRVISELAALGNLEALRRLSQTLERLVSGEWRQLALRGSVETTRNDLETVARDKTASLMAWCCWVPAQLANASEEVQVACWEFGELVGLAFQMKDDELDFSERGEKRYAQDLKEGLINFLALELMDVNPKLREPIGATVRAFPMLEEQETWPWTVDEIEKARFGLQARVAKILETAHSAFRKFAPVAETAHSKTIEALLALLGFVAERPN